MEKDRGRFETGSRKDDVSIISGDWSGAVSSVGMPDATRSWKRQGAASSLEPLERS